MQFHGFVEVRMLPRVLGNYPKETEVVETLRAETNWSVFQHAAFIDLNGQWFFTAHGNHNHASAFQPVRELLDKLVSRAPGSYGLFYVNNDEDDLPEMRERFRVLVIRRGTMSEGADPFLSPFTPIVLDPFDVNEF